MLKEPFGVHYTEAFQTGCFWKAKSQTQKLWTGRKVTELKMSQVYTGAFTDYKEDWKLHEMAHLQGQGSMDLNNCHFVDLVLRLKIPFIAWYMPTGIVAVGDN